MSGEATKKLQALLEDGFDLTVSFERGMYTLRIRKERTSSSAMLHIQCLRANGSDELAQVLDLMREDFDNYLAEHGEQENHDG